MRHRIIGVTWTCRAYEHVCLSLQSESRAYMPDPFHRCSIPTQNRHDALSELMATSIVPQSKQEGDWWQVSHPRGLRTSIASWRQLSERPTPGDIKVNQLRDNRSRHQFGERVVTILSWNRASLPTLLLTGPQSWPFPCVVHLGILSSPLTPLYLQKGYNPSI
jgi:hypothetical protein